MGRPKSDASRTTVYRLHRLAELSDAFRSRYTSDENFVQTQTSVSGRDALLLVGTMKSERASWADRLARLAEVPVAIGNTTAAAVLVIRDEADDAWALAYGMGFQLLDVAHIDASFG